MLTLAEKEDFLHLVWSLRTGREIDRDDLVAALTGLPLANIQSRTRRTLLGTLLKKSLAGDASALSKFEHLAIEVVRIPTEWIEEELRESAWELYGETWQTPLYRTLQQASSYADSERWEAFEEALGKSGETVRKQLNKYRSQYIMQSEITQETVVGHRLLMEALDTWLKAIDEMIDAVETGASQDAALELAEYASRLSTMCGIYARRVSRA